MPPIKLKLSLGGLTPSAPATPATPIIKIKGKNKVANGHGEPSTPGVLDSPSPAPIATPKIKLKNKPKKSSGLSSRHVSVGAGDEEDGLANGSKPGPSTIRLTLPRPPSAAPSPSPIATSPAATPAATPLTMTPATPAPTTPVPERIPKKRGRPPKIRPTAIPPHVVTPQAVRSPTASAGASAASTPPSTAEFFNIKAEPVDYDEADPLSLPISPAAGAITPLDESSMSTPGAWEGNSEFTTYNPRVVKWKRVKRPFKELANKALHEMRRKDVYGFFLEPVNLEDYPDYLEVVGGADKMMDLQTMQTKVDENEYRSMDELEADFKTMIDAALKFNLPGTAPYREANKVQVHGQKHIDRAKPLVLTPSPSPEREPEPQRQSVIPDSEVGTPAPIYLGKPQKDVPPKNIIPDAMLAFPPNSLQAQAIGWNLTGGRIVRPKRMVRGREKFFGKWREYSNDGSRDLAEMDDPQEHLDIFRQLRGDEWRTVTDWPTMLDGNQGKAWWDWEGPGGATGQPPLPNTERLKPEPLKTRELGTFDFGVYPDIERELSSLQTAKDSQPYDPEDDELDVLVDQLRSDAPPPVKVPPNWPAQSFVNAYDRPSATHWLYNMSLGGVRGEAYNNSVQKFLDGAIGSARANGAKATDETASILQEYVANKWRGGVLQSDTSRLANDTVGALVNAAAKTEAGAGNDEPPSRPELAPEAVLKNAHDAYARIALRSLTSAANPLDIQPLLREPSDFLYLGVGGKSGVNDAVAWVGSEINRVSGVRTEAKMATGAVKGDEGDVEMVEAGTSTPAPAEPAAPFANGDVAHAGLKRRNSDSEPNDNDAKRRKLEEGVALETASKTAEPAVEAAAEPAADVAPTPSVTLPTTSNATTPAPMTPASAPAAAPQPASTETATVTAPAPPPDETENGLRQLRLELVALSKFYPLASLKKMSKEDAERLLPPNVRNLMTRPEK
ncbi:Bromodomain-containing protein 9 [Vanrija pseudolonga]|uniref:Bromodomain-containing protein 9 n=1 Tax=Vanrija pseudolonga TaxID=143232 RepID=A0AAF1BMW2_9TREE|nr:Bromodomain-containing protein 9 [Vanrija pseudolonga]